jgi:hypothetical protein
MPSSSQSDFSDGIVMWVKKKTGSEIDFVKLEYDVEELLLQVDTPFAVAFLEKFEVDESSAQMEPSLKKRIDIVVEVFGR